MPNRLKEIREKAGVTLEALGEAIGTSPQQVSRLENAERKLSLEWIEKIARAFGVRPGLIIDPGELPAFRLRQHLEIDGDFEEREAPTLPQPSQQPQEFDLLTVWGEIQPTDLPAAKDILVVLRDKGRIAGDAEAVPVLVDLPAPRRRRKKSR